MAPILYIVIPCYNEEVVLPITNQLFIDELQKMISLNMISEYSCILYVDDGSRDSTWQLIMQYSAVNSCVKGIKLSRNRGHQNAVLAGLMTAKEYCDAVISIDCDGQDDISAMEQMMDAYMNGADIVYGIRSDRSSDSFFKRFTAESYYHILNSMGVEVVFNHADYRLTSKRVLKEFSKFQEVNLFLRGMFPLVGFNSTSVYYERHERMAGKSHYPLKKMLILAFDGITSLSIKPIRFIALTGFLIAFISFLGVIWAVVGKLIGTTVPGWASTTSIVCMISGIQMLSLGVIGEYIGKIYLEVKKRPRYIIECGTDDELL